MTFFGAGVLLTYSPFFARPPSLPRTRARPSLKITPGGHECVLVRMSWGQRAMAECLLERGADLNWVGHDGQSPLDAANRSGAAEVVLWLRSKGAKSATKST